jgi:hypothetical protein
MQVGPASSEAAFRRSKVPAGRRLGSGNRVGSPGGGPGGHVMGLCDVDLPGNVRAQLQRPLRTIRCAAGPPAATPTNFPGVRVPSGKDKQATSGNVFAPVGAVEGAHGAGTAGFRHGSRPPERLADAPPRWPSARRCTAHASGDVMGRIARPGEGGRLGVEAEAGQDDDDGGWIGDVREDASSGSARTGEDVFEVDAA